MTSYPPSRAFCQAYAAAIAAAAKTDKPYTVSFIKAENRFTPSECDDGLSPTDFAIFISDDWRKRIERLNLQVPDDPKSQSFPWDDLINRIAERLQSNTEEGVIEQLVRGELEF